MGSGLREGFQQIRIAETEKYAHVTYFLTAGARLIPERIEFSCPRRMFPRDLKPEMSAPEVTEEVLKALDKGSYRLLVVNYANADMVGHTGELEAAIKAVETVDREVGIVVSRTLQKGGMAIVTADHGNAEKMIDEEGNPHTAHTRSDTPFILVTARDGYTLPPRGKLADVAPTILKLLSLPIPPEMSGISLI